MSKVLVFELRGHYAHFKIPETTRGAISFPFPPRTAMMGILAGILGYERNSYWKEGHPLREAKIAIEVIQKVKSIPLKVNYTQTKPEFILGIDKVRILIPSDPLMPGRRGFGTQFRLDLLKDPAYRVYVAIEDNITFDKLTTSLQEHCYKYPPYLGHANLFAEIDFVGVFEYEYVKSGRYDVTGLIPLSVVDIDSESFIAGDFHIVHGVPMSFKIKEEIETLDGRYGAITELERIESVAFQIEGTQEPISLQAKDELVARVTLEDGKKNLVFLPGE